MEIRKIFLWIFSLSSALIYSLTVLIMKIFFEQAFRHGSILLQRPQLLQAPGSSLVSRLVDCSVEFKDHTLITDDHIVMSEVTPKVNFIPVYYLHTLKKQWGYCKGLHPSVCLSKGTNVYLCALKLRTLQCISMRFFP